MMSTQHFLSTFPIVERLTHELTHLHAAIETNQRTISGAESRALQLDAEASKTGDLKRIGELSSSRAQLRREAEQAQRKVSAAQARLAFTARQLEEITEALNRLFERRTTLYHQLGEAHSREEAATLREDLLVVLTRLAQASGRAEDIDKVKQLRRLMAEAASYWICDRPLYFNRDRTKVVEEDDPQAAFTYTGPGVRIDKSEARRWGLIPQEAQHG